MPANTRVDQQLRFEKAERESMPAAQPRVWLVEDSALQARQTSDALATHDVEIFADGESMLERLVASEPELIILDWSLPGVSGLEVLRHVRATRDEVTLPILVLTASRGDVAFRTALGAGANDFVTKPCPADVLRARVNTLLRVRTLFARAREAEEERTIALERVHALEVRTQIALDAANLGTYELDATTGALSLDANARRQLGVEPDVSALVDAVIEAAIHRDDRPRIREALKASLDPTLRAPFRGEYRVTQPDGDERWYVAHGKPFFEGARPVRIVGALLDVTERKRAHEELERDAAFRERFVGILAHDLRTPLSALALLGQSLARGVQGPDERQKTGNRVAVIARRMSRMIEDLLDFTRSRLGGGMPVLAVETNLDTICRAVVHEVQLAYPDARVVVASQGDPLGRWDSDRLQQVVSNLVSNAVQHAADDVAIRVTTSGAADHVSIEVHNEGKAIPRALLPLLFDPFRRAASEGSASARVRGLGLGLYIVDQIARAHGGSVAVTSTDSDGTAFTVRLPRFSPSTPHA